MKIQSQQESEKERCTAEVLVHQAAVRWQISRLVSDPLTVDDLAQEVFVAWIQRTGPANLSLSPPESARPWLLKVARNKAIDWLRRNSRLPVSTPNLDSLVGAGSSPAATSGEESADPDCERRLDALRHCLGLLQSEHRAIVAEFYGQGKSSELIGARLGKGSGSVRMILTRIRRALGKCIRRQLEKKP